MIKKRYIFFDIDGTLAAGKAADIYFPQSTLIAIEKLKKAGHFLCIATGRTRALAIDYLHQLGLKDMVSNGGYGITINDEIAEFRSLPKAPVLQLLKECDQLDIPWAIQVDDSNIRLVRDNRFDEVTGDVFLTSRIITDLNPMDYDNIYKAFIACDRSRDKELKALEELPCFRNHDEYIYVEPMDKASGIKKILDHYKADYEDAIVFGDSDNDISMFQDCWTKVAMGNATPGLRNLADYVTDSVTQDGIYNACEKLGLF